MNVYLIGYRCTGKTTIAKRLSEKLGWGYLDADVKLTEDYGMTIADMVRKEGWAGFRKKEKSVLQEISTYTGHAIATGSGFCGQLAQEFKGSIMTLRSSARSKHLKHLLEFLEIVLPCLG